MSIPSPAGVPAPSASSALENSGRIWVARFPTSKRVEDLEPNFRGSVKRFLGALADADVAITISATLRPRQRAYLMHYAWCIVQGKVAPGEVPAFVPRPGEQPVNIRWLHLDANQKPNAVASLAAARDMVGGYQISNLHVAPSLTSLHMEGKAIDMTLSWDGELNIDDATGKTVTIRSMPRSGVNPELIKLGATYGVRHLIAVNKDPPHWSVNGH
jgi:hypothetical protein